MLKEGLSINTTLTQLSFRRTIPLNCIYNFDT
jgi:hypothetical protein